MHQQVVDSVSARKHEKLDVRTGLSTLPLHRGYIVDSLMADRCTILINSGGLTFSFYRFTNKTQAVVVVVDSSNAFHLTASEIHSCAIGFFKLFLLVGG